MIKFRLRTAALASTLAAAAVASPALAKERARHPGFEARAQAVDPGEALMTPEREKALRECSEIANRLVQKDWGVMQDERMGSCMRGHGQPQ